MLFNSYPFIFLFLPLAITGYYVIGRWSGRAAAAWLVGVSLFFYGYWSLASLPLLVGSVLANYVFGAILSDPVRSGRRALLVAFIAANLALLGYFKYANFFIDNVNALLRATGNPALGFMAVVMPIGISFFTFTQIAFLLDSYQGTVRPRSLSNYMLFVTFFPHLIAGPVLHHKQMMPQFADPVTYRLNPHRIAIGIALFTLGLAKKLLLADELGPYADLLFASARDGIEPRFLLSWSGSLAYTFQLYFDFSGYSDMAVGLSLLFGVLLPINFNAPLRATSIIDFWQRWHMSLTKYVGQYLYTPLTLALTRAGDGKPPLVEVTCALVIPTVATFLVLGLWHGPSWHYVLFGAMHGGFLVINHLWRRGKSATPTPASRALGWLLTFTAVNVAFVMFRADSISTALEIYRGMLGLHGLVAPGIAPDSLTSIVWQRLPLSPAQSAKQFALAMSAALLVTLFLPSTATLTPASRKERNNVALLTWPWVPATLAVLFVASVLSISATSAFLYFQF